MGNATRTWLITSGGVIIAEITNMTIIACFLYDFRKSGVMTPALVKKNMIMGSWNIMAQATTIINMVET